MTHTSKTIERSMILYSTRAIYWGGRAEAYFVHISVLSAVDGKYTVVSSHIPQPDELVSSHTHCSASIACHFDWVYAAAVSLEVGDILSTFRVPNLKLMIIWNNERRNILLKPPERSMNSSTGLKQTVLTMAEWPSRGKIRSSWLFYWSYKSGQISIFIILSLEPLAISLEVLDQSRQ